VGAPARALARGRRRLPRALAALRRSGERAGRLREQVEHAVHGDGGTEAWIDLASVSQSSNNTVAPLTDRYSVLKRRNNALAKIHAQWPSSFDAS